MNNTERVRMMSLKELFARFDVRIEELRDRIKYIDPKTEKTRYENARYELNSLLGRRKNLEAKISKGVSHV